MVKDTKYCSGCDDNFYNGNNPLGVKECWKLEDAKVIKRWAIGWQTPMDRKENFYKVTTHSCRHENGHTAFMNELPSHLGGEKA